MFSNRLFGGCQKQQYVVSRSSKKSECIAFAICLRETLCIEKFKELFTEVRPNAGLDRMLNIFIGEDNLVCNKDVYDPSVSELSKHIGMKYEMLVDHVGKRDVQLDYVLTE